MNITLCSAFRNAESYLTRYFLQVAGLEKQLLRCGDCLHLILAEGDSTDYTWPDLSFVAADHDADVLQCSHGGPDYGSVVNAERFANLSKVWNAIWARIPQDADAVLFVESDLIWQPATMMALLDDLATYPAVSPMIILQREDWPPNLFYDTWGGRKDGNHISHHAPYFAGWDMQTPIQVDSMGSCMAIRGDLAQKLCWPAEDVIVGVCRQIYKLGGSVWLDPMQKVEHQ